MTWSKRRGARKRSARLWSALGALLLTAMGLFGVGAGSVTRRRHELAVRLAVGADYQRVLRLVLVEGALLVSVGLLIGAPGINFGYRMIRGLLVGVSPYDPLALLAARLSRRVRSQAVLGPDGFTPRLEGSRGP